MRLTYFLFLLLFIFFLNCEKQKFYLNKIEGKQIVVSDSMTEDIDIEAFIKPYRKNIQKDLDSVLAYAIDTYSKNDGAYNTALGNLMVDAIFNEANPIFNKRTGKDIDMVLLNHEGIRAVLPKGDISKRTAFKLMPFENSIVVVALKSPQIDSLLVYLSQSKRAHPISKLTLTLDENDNIVDAKIKGKPISSNTTYYVATSDYLYNGGDNMVFFKTTDSLYRLNYKIRNVLIDYFTKKDTLKPVKDDRFIKIK